MVRPRPAGAAGQGDLADRTWQRRQLAEPDSADGHREARRARIRRQPEQQPRDGSALSTTCRSSVVNGATIYMRDVAHVRDGFAAQTNIVRQDGRRARCSRSSRPATPPRSTIVEQVKALLPRIRAAAPPGLELKELFDQSLFVRAAIDGVLTEGAIAACLTGLMILLFLGSWRSTLIVIVSIPLSILTSLAILQRARPDDQRHDARRAGAGGRHPRRRRHGRDREHPPQPRDWASRSCRRSSTARSRSPCRRSSRRSAICIVFVPVVFLTGPAKYLFTPLALAVVFAMLPSYLLSRTLVPTMVQYLLRQREPRPGPTRACRAASCGRLHAGVRARLRAAPRRLRRSAARDRAAPRRARVLVVLALVAGERLVRSCRFVGRDFFPDVDAGQIRLHVRAPAGTRIEETEQRRSTTSRPRSAGSSPRTRSQLHHRQHRPAPSPHQPGLRDSATDRAGGRRDPRRAASRSTTSDRATTCRRCAASCRASFPRLTFYFQPADIVSQILNFGLPAPIDVQVIGLQSTKQLRDRARLARRMARRFRARSTCTCTRSSNCPTLRSTSTARRLPSSA